MKRRIKVKKPGKIVDIQAASLWEQATGREGEIDSKGRRPAPRQYYKPLQKRVTMFLDADVLAWLRARGRGYQRMINNSLRELMLAGLKKSGK